MREIFPHMNNILFDGIKTGENITNQRAMLYAKDAMLLKETGIEYTYDNWNELPQGRFDVTLNSYRFSCVFNMKKGPLYVILNGALMSKVPEFKRWSYYRFLDGSMLDIADPMYYIYDDLKLGWYYGDKENNLREYLSCIIKKAAQILGLPNEKIVILGSSGGGAAAIHAGWLIDGSTVIAINSQIKLSLYYYHEMFTKITGIDLCNNDEFGRNDTINLLNSSSSKTKFILLENARSVVDCDQIEHILPTLPYTPQYGLTQYGNVILWIYEAVHSGKGGAHGAQEYHEILYAILHLTRIIQSDASIEEYKSLYMLFTEFWSDHKKIIDDHKKIIDGKKMTDMREVKKVSLSASAVNAEKCNNIICKKELVVSADEKENFKSIIVCDNLKVNTLYYLRLKDVSCEGNKKEIFSVLIRDLKANAVYCREEYKADTEINYFFITNENTDDLVLRIYAGKAAKTANCTLKIGELLLCEL